MPGNRGPPPPPRNRRFAGIYLRNRVPPALLAIQKVVGRRVPRSRVESQCRGDAGHASLPRLRAVAATLQGVRLIGQGFMSVVRRFAAGTCENVVRSLFTYRGFRSCRGRLTAEAPRVLCLWSDDGDGSHVRDPHSSVSPRDRFSSPARPSPVLLHGLEAELGRERLGGLQDREAELAMMLRGEIARRDPWPWLQEIREESTGDHRDKE